MTRQLSFSGYERKILPQFREKMNKAESTEDVKKVFIHTVEELLDGVFDGTVKMEDEDLMLLPDSKPYFQMSDRLRGEDHLKFYWTDSDLHHVIYRMAKSAAKRYKHLEKHPEKTEIKIRM